MWLDPTEAVASLTPTASAAYQLLIRVDGSVRLRIASLGPVDLHAGWYVYTGSAKRAPAARLARHLRKRKPCRWHIDYLLARPQSRIAAVRLCTWRLGLECRMNRRLIDKHRAHAPVPGFGSSDCTRGCPAHLLFLCDPPDGMITP